jgi:hypothetical protein
MALGDANSDLDAILLKNFNLERDNGKHVGNDLALYKMSKMANWMSDTTSGDFTPTASTFSVEVVPPGYCDNNDAV